MPSSGEHRLNAWVGVADGVGVRGNGVGVTVQVGEDVMVGVTAGAVVAGRLWAEVRPQPARNRIPIPSNKESLRDTNLFVVFKPHTIHLLVLTTFCQQFFMSALLDDDAVVDHGDTVRVDYSG